MNDKQSEALRLADALDTPIGVYGLPGREAAAELRRLHQENEKLREAGVGYSQQTMDAVVRERENLRSLNAELLGALKEAENALADYIPSLEKNGAMLNYGRSVWRRAEAAIAKAAITKAEGRS